MFITNTNKINKIRKTELSLVSLLEPRESEHNLRLNAALLLEGGNSFRCGRLVEASHVFMHFWKTLLHVILRTAFPHCPKTKTL